MEPWKKIHYKHDRCIHTTNLSIFTEDKEKVTCESCLKKVKGFTIDRHHLSVECSQCFKFNSSHSNYCTRCGCKLKEE